MLSPFIARNAAFLALFPLLWTVPTHAEPATYDAAPINYSSTAPNDPAQALKRDIDSGKLKLTAKPHRGYLDSMLKALDISPASQTLVFSQTSFQQQLISPSNPRALYFNDETYIGFVPGGEVIEIASSDPKLGTIFYSVEQPKGALADETPAPKFARQTDNCLQCHGESMTRGIPGLLVRSVFPNASGQPIFSAGTFITTRESPLSERWGGWYVTGDVADKHMGNICYAEQEGKAPLPLPTPAKDIATQFDASYYLSPHSDVVALMVLEHQTEAHNLITRANYGTVMALRDERVIADALGQKLTPGSHSESTRSRIKGSCEPLVECLLFADEAPLAGPIKGSSDFAAEFTARGPRDAHGRSLRDFDLAKRLFRFPCSYLIYSASFQGLPDAAREQVYDRLLEVLTGKDTGKAFKHLSSDDRTVILEILRDALPQLRERWKNVGH